MLGEQDLFEALDACWTRLGGRVRPQDFVANWFSHDCTIDTALLAAVEEWRRSGGRCVLATN
jgi:hypothetical protein